MRPIFAALALCCALTAIPANGAEGFPYKAYISADDVYVRSGPGQDYYPTDKLKAGQQVEVYRHDPGGWYAIRPVPDSYSWVSARYLQLQPDNLARVIGDRVACRVGTSFSDKRDVIQVRLNRDELVEVLGSKEQRTGDGTVTWYKIAPPSGEFRWIYGKYVDRAEPYDGIRRTADRNDPEALSTEQLAPSDDILPVEEVRYAPSEPREIPPEQFSAELDELDMELSIMVAEEPTVWEFGEMRLRADSLLLHAETALERGKARLLVNKIARFADLKHRMDEIESLRAKNEREKRAYAQTDPSEREPLEGDRWDGSGELTRVISPKVGAPRYALVDELGKVRWYVTAAPGVRLRNYLGRKVGVNGTRGYMPEQRAHHITAQHISPLDGGLH